MKSNVKDFRLFQRQVPGSSELGVHHPMLWPIPPCATLGSVYL